MPIAHIVRECDQRTEDISSESNLDFDSFYLSPNVLNGLKKAGFQHPSPIQEKAIPLAKLGVDLICQAKSGTGKTCVFAVAALEAVNVESNALQVLVLAPTREIAYQVKDVITTIGAVTEDLKCHLFIGGISEDFDVKNLKSCHIAVGTPGRIKSLIEKKVMVTDSVRLFVLDEADKLIEEGSFQKQINWIFSTLPKCKQMMALSATYPKSLAEFLENYMNDPSHVRINTTDVALIGVRQYYCVVPSQNLPNKTFEEKIKVLLELIKNIPFHQCMVFSNYQTGAEHLSNLLTKRGWPSTFIAGYQTQTTRLQAMDKLKNYNCRIFITTDICSVIDGLYPMNSSTGQTSRGIDCDKVNLVVNMDIPWDTETYLHRVGRAGRFGSQGTAITIISGKEYTELQNISTKMMKDIEHITDLEANNHFQLTCDTIIRKYTTIRCNHDKAGIMPTSSTAYELDGSPKAKNAERNEMIISNQLNDTELDSETKKEKSFKTEQNVDLDLQENSKYSQMPEHVTQNLDNSVSTLLMFEGSLICEQTTEKCILKETPHQVLTNEKPINKLEDKESGPEAAKVTPDTFDKLQVVENSVSLNCWNKTLEKIKSASVTEILEQWNSITITPEEVMEEIIREHDNKMPKYLAFYGSEIETKDEEEIPLRLVPIQNLITEERTGDDGQSLNNFIELNQEGTGPPSTKTAQNHNCTFNNNKSIKISKNLSENTDSPSHFKVNGSSTIIQQEKEHCIPSKTAGKRIFHLMSVNLDRLHLTPNSRLDENSTIDERRTVIFQRNVNDSDNDTLKSDHGCLRNNGTSSDSRTADNELSEDETSTETYTTDSEADTSYVNTESDNDALSGNESDSEEESGSDSVNEIGIKMFRNKQSSSNESGNESDCENDSNLESTTDIDFQTERYSPEKKKTFQTREKVHTKMKFAESNRTKRKFDYPKFYYYWNLAYQNHSHALKLYKHVGYFYKHKHL